jgi:glucose/arabinose dehydrogenase
MRGRLPSGAAGRWLRLALLLTSAAVVAGSSAQRAIAQQKLVVKVATGYTLTTIASDLHVPRAVVQTDASTAYVVEFGGWNKNTGSLVKLTSTGGTWKSLRVLTKLDRPLGLVTGPDGKLYLGEVGRISRFDPRAATVKLERVITDLPGKGLHPLSAMAFTGGADPAMIVNVGSSTNNCEKSKGTPLCPVAEGKNPLAALRRYSFDWKTGKVQGFRVIARGLRNSAGLAVHSSGTILEADNGRDAINDANPKLSDETLPHDELNVIIEGANYGWPYCYDNRVNAPEFPRYNCASTTAPHVLLPAHSAPLGLTYWGNDVIVSYHGYRDTGHRLVAFAVDAVGKVSGPGRGLLSDWNETDTQQMGGPVGSSVGVDGALWFTDDRNNLILRLARS